MARKFKVSVNGKNYEVEVEEIKGGQSVATQATAQYDVAAPAAPAPAAGGTGSVAVEAPMQGKVVEVKVSVGQTVADGDVVAILEAMKMENEIIASTGGTVASVNVVAGQSVEAQDVIITLN